MKTLENAISLYSEKRDFLSQFYLKLIIPIAIRSTIHNCDDVKFLCTVYNHVTSSLKRKHKSKRFLQINSIFKLK